MGHAITAGLTLGTFGNVRSTRAATEKVTFQLDWIPFGRHAPYYLALERGFYAQRSLEVTIIQGTGSVPGLRQLASGNVDFLFADIGPMIAVRSRDGVRAKAISCVYQKTPNTIFFIQGGGIAKPKDLEGRKIAYSPGDKTMFPAFAQANGIDESKISWTSADPNSKNALLLARNVDSMMTYIFTKPILQNAAKSGDIIDGFVYSDWGVDFYANGIVAMEDYIKQKPEVVRQFVQATMDGIREALAHPAQAVAALKKHQPQLNEELALKEIPLIKELIMSNGSSQPLGAMDLTKMTRTVELTIKYLELKTAVEPDRVFTNEFLA
jgi:NitT/TauT family transport system substrate-binding protein